MSENKSILLKKLTKQLAIGVPVVALSGFLPGTDGVLVGQASAEGGSEAGYNYKAKAEAESKYKSKKYKKAKSEAEAHAEGKAEGKAEAEGKSEAEAH